MIFFGGQTYETPSATTGILTTIKIAIFVQ
jgi:hypothetical protein